MEEARALLVERAALAEDLGAAGDWIFILARRAPLAGSISVSGSTRRQIDACAQTLTAVATVRIQNRLAAIDAELEHMGVDVDLASNEGVAA